MPRLNRVFEEMKVVYGDRKVPDKVLKSIQEKAAKAATSVAPPVTTARAELRKRRGTDTLKAVAKKRKSARTAKDPADEEMVESAHEGSIAAPASAAASAAAGDEDLMVSSIRDVGGGSSSIISDVASFPSVLSEDSSSSVEADASDGSVSASGHKEITSDKLGRPAKSPSLGRI